MTNRFETGGDIDSIRDIRHYMGGEPCQYRCGEPAEFVVLADSIEMMRLTFVGCRRCLNRAAIFPIKNGWVDAHTNLRRLA